MIVVTDGRTLTGIDPGTTTGGTALDSRIVVRSRAVVITLASVALFFLVTDLIVQTIDMRLEPGFTVWPQIVRFLDLNDESSLPTWFAVTMLGIAALLAGVIALAVWRHGERYRWHWVALVVLIAGFSIDEGAQIHDSPSDTPLRDIVGTNGVLHYAWVIPALVSAAVVALVFARFFFALPERTRILFAFSAATFVTGAVGFEMASGWYADHNPGPSLVYETLSSLEEFLELAGVVLLIAGLLDYAGRRLGRTEIVWDTESRTQ